MDEWKLKAWLFHQEMFRILGSRKWDDLEGEKQNLLNKLDAAFAMCFGVDYKDNQNVKDIFENFTKRAVYFFNEKFYREHFSFTFVDWKNLDNDNSGRFLVIWLQNSSGYEICLDLNGRNYDSWQEFLDNNVLQKCNIMYPKHGRYSSGCLAEHFIDLNLKESRACSVQANAKSVCDYLALAGGAIATGVLIFNPVSASVLIGAVGVSVLTGGYNVANSVGRLYDIHKHEGGLSMDSKTLLAVGELAASAVGTAAIGAAAGVKAFSAATGTVLSEGSLIYRLANNVTQVTKFFSGLNAGFGFLVVIDKYNREGNLGSADLRQLARVIFLALNVIASNSLIKSAVKYLAASFSINYIIDCCIRSRDAAFSTVKRVVKLVSDNQLTQLVKKIFPDCSVYIERISNIAPLIQRTSSIFDRTVSTLMNKKFDVNYIYFLQKELISLWDDVKQYRRNNKLAIQSNFDQETAKSIENWTQNDSIDLPNCGTDCEDKIKSQFDNKINTPVEMKKKIIETIQTCFGHIDSSSVLKKREKTLYSELLKLIQIHELKDNTYVQNKINFYCTYFKSLFNKLMELYHYEHFLYYTGNNESVTKGRFFTNIYKVNDIHEACFNIAIKLLKQNIEKCHENFENKFTAADEKPQERQIFELDMLCYSSELTEEEYYEKAKSLIPRLGEKLNNLNTTFDNLDDVVIIKSNDNDFALFFYIVIENDHAKGILLLVEKLINE